MARVLALLTSVGVLTACGASAASVAPPPAPSPLTPIACGPPSARTLAASRMARIYVSGQTALGCAAGAHRTLRLGSEGACTVTGRIGVAAITDRTAAYAVTRCGVDQASAEVVVRRLDTGVRQSTHPAMAAPGPESITSVTALVVRSDGAAAWIGHASSIVRHSTATAVFAAGRSGVRRLDSGAAISAAALRLGRSDVFWRHGARWRSAHL